MGAAIGGAVGGVVLAVILGVVVVLWCRRRGPYRQHQKYDRTGRPVLDDQNMVQTDADTFNKPFTPFVEEGEVLAPFDTPPQPPNAEEIARAEKVQRFRASLPQPPPPLQQASTSSAPISTRAPQPEVGDVDPYELPPPSQTRNELEVARAHKLQQMGGQPSGGPSNANKEAANPLPPRALPPAPAPTPQVPQVAPNPPASLGVAPAVPPIELIESLMELNVPNEEIAAVVRRMAAREGPVQRMPWDDDLPPSYDPQDRQPPP